jgi:hypothetical protein
MEVAEAEQAPGRRGRVLFPKGVSGNAKGRRAIRERAAALYAIMAPDFGELSATDNILLLQASLLLARSERVHRVRDIDVGLRMSGEARRLLQSLRRHRVPAPREPMASEVLRARYATVQPVGEPEPEMAAEAADDESRTAGLPEAAENTSSDVGASS